MPAKKEPLVVWDDVERAFYEALGRAGVDPKEAKSWAPIVIGSRISRLEHGRSTAPERQIRNGADWCVDHKKRPVGLVAEETSGSIYRQKRRKILEQFFDDIANDRIRDPETGEIIDGIAYWRYDRFTRTPDEGGPWLQLLMQKGINLYATQYSDPPRPLFQIEHDIRSKWIDAAREVDADRQRGMDEILRKLRDGEPPYGCELWGRRRVVDPRTAITRRYRANPKDKKIALRIAQDVLDGKRVYAVAMDLQRRGVKNVAGTDFKYASLLRLLRAPHLAGLTRVRCDQSRLHDPSYTGELFPAELIYRDGGAPPEGYMPAIEPLIPYPLWERLQLELDRRQSPRGPRRRHLCSGFFNCSACGGTIIAGSGHYKCNMRHLQGRPRADRADGTRTAADGKRHPAIKVPLLDRLVEEIVFAAIDTDRSAAMTTDSTNRAEPAVDDRAERRVLLDQLAEFAERIGNTSYMLSQGHITRNRYDELVREIETERREVEADLRALASEAARPALPNDTTLRDLWTGMDVDAKRQWVELVLEGGSVKPIHRGRGEQPLAERITLTFRDGYAPPASEVAAVIARVDDALRLRRIKRQKPSPELAERLIELHTSDLTHSRIVDLLNGEGWDSPVEGKSWDTSSFKWATKHVYAERGLTYVPRTHVARQRRLPSETLELMRGIYERCLSWTETARTLEEMGMRRPNGASWDSCSVSHTVYDAARRLGWDITPPTAEKKHVGRPRYLDGATREMVWHKHRTDGLSLREVGEWLEEIGILTARRKKHWSPGSIFNIVRSVDEEKARAEGRSRAA